MAHESQDGRSFPVLPRGQDIHRCFPKDQARSRRELIEQEDQGHANSGRFIGPSIMQGEGIAFIFNLCPIVLERLNEVCFPIAASIPHKYVQPGSASREL